MESPPQDFYFLQETMKSYKNLSCLIRFLQDLMTICITVASFWMLWMGSECWECCIHRVCVCVCVCVVCVLCVRV